MINTLRIYEELSQAMDPKAAHKLASVLGVMYEDLQNTVTKAEFNELRSIVGELAEAQKRTEQRLDSLTQRVEELAEAQKRTEARVEELAEAQKRTEARVEELAEAQKRTEKAVAQLVRCLDDTNRQVGGLAMTVGYTLENEAYKALPALLERDHGLKLVEPLRRGHLQDAEGRDLEVNILGRGEKDGEPVWIIGECKAQLSKKDIDRFLKRRLAALEPTLGKIFPVIVAHMVTARDVPDHARARGVALYLSYEFGW